MWFDEAMGQVLNVFARRPDVEAATTIVSKHLRRTKARRSGSEVQITAKGDTGSVVVNLGTAHFAGEAGAAQRAGFAAWSRRTMGGPGVETVASMAPEFVLAVAFVADDPIPTTRAGTVFGAAVALAAAFDGIVLSVEDGTIWDEAGGVLASVELKTSGPEQTAGATDDDDVEEDPPTLDRIVARFVCLVAVAFRGIIEQDGPPAEETRSGVLRWIEALGADSELDPAERALLESAVGGLTQRQTINACWRFEGVALLGHAIGLWDLPPYDRTIDVDVVAAALGVPDASKASDALGRVHAPQPDERRNLRLQLLALHWRVRDFGLRRRSLAFADFAQTAWFGPLDLTMARIANDGDLEIDDVPISSAQPAALSKVTSIITERHLAANWLCWGDIYSETDTST